MSYNGSGTFVINSAGTPYVSGTVISSTAANALNNDLATGLTTALTKDGQTTPTANIPLGGFKITNLGAGTVASDAARLSQVQNSTTTTLISITGTDTLTGTVSPTLTAYSTGQVFSWVVASTNTGAVTLNVDSIGVKAVTRTGAVALVAGDMVTGQVAIVEYDGTRFQLINGNSFTNLKASGTLGVTGITTVAAGSAAAPSIVSTTGTADTGQWFPAADTIAYSTAGSERVRITSAGDVGLGTTSPTQKLQVNGAIIIGNFGSDQYLYFDGSTNYVGRNSTSGDIHLASAGGTNIVFTVAAAEKMRIDSSGNVFMGTTTQVDGARLTLYGGSLAGLGFATSQNATTINMSIDSLGGLTTRKSGADFWYFGRSGSANCVNAGGNWVDASDERLKENIVTLPDALNKVCSLRGVSFNRISSGKPEIGLIAQEVQQVYPDVIEEGDFLGLHYGALVGALVEAIKDLKTITEAQAARITALETA